MTKEETVVEAWKDVFRTLREVERAVVEVEEEENDEQKNSEYF